MLRQGRAHARYAYLPAYTSRGITARRTCSGASAPCAGSARTCDEASPSRYVLRPPVCAVGRVYLSTLLISALGEGRACTGRRRRGAETATEAKEKQAPPAEQASDKKRGGGQTRTRALGGRRAGIGAQGAKSPRLGPVAGALVWLSLPTRARPPLRRRLVSRSRLHARHACTQVHIPDALPPGERIREQERGSARASDTTPLPLGPVRPRLRPVTARSCSIRGPPMGRRPRAAGSMTRRLQRGGT
ncbi:hypothetical protein GGS23DRAFT_131136 [Durotheca rogersii]|uniref:uncharacterized protein n=1 Tax=Durotheca rogersii TaxID=419775 RepID=UPI00221E886D|nr:uncharacterized protein GGS23DRAFT_131136 [Durotheca rogersii]KAI5861782.1 hypothetical protein GGS23DRAFT_131136 [Durotheca rogersii]